MPFEHSSSKSHSSKWTVCRSPALTSVSGHVQCMASINSNWSKLKKFQSSPFPSDMSREKISSLQQLRECSANFFGNSALGCTANEKRVRKGKGDAQLIKLRIPIIPEWSRKMDFETPQLIWIPKKPFFRAVTPSESHCFIFTCS